MLTYPWKCTVLHCNHLGNTWKPLVLMTRHFDYCPSASKGDSQSVRSSAPVVSRCFPGGYNVKLYISRGRLAWWLLAFLHSATTNRWSFNLPQVFVWVCISKHYHFITSRVALHWIITLYKHIVTYVTIANSDAESKTLRFFAPILIFMQGFNWGFHIMSSGL